MLGLGIAVETRQIPGTEKCAQAGPDVCKMLFHLVLFLVHRLERIGS